MTRKVEGTVTLEDVRIMFKNFRGIEGTMNRDGDRNYCVVLNEQQADELSTAGWNVRTLQPKEEGDSPLHYIQVKLRYGGRPPRVVMVTARGRTELDESTVGLLDMAMIEKADLIIAPYNWEVRGETGVTAYTRSLYVTIEEDELELKYIDVPDSTLSSMCTPGVDCEGDPGYRNRHF